MLQPVTSVRMDKWLWSVRLYKTRSLATAACASGKVRIADQPVKPAHSVKIGEIVSAVTGDLTRTVKVIALLEHRIGAKLVPDFLEDLTPAAEYNKKREPNFQPVGLRPKGTGRPTKRERRELENLWIELNQ